eukprot:CAMPEP_0184652738 /NCGR_PEP_ID=MMETSP0308-20130426/10440_1 /TAXON_ID=38269 /ORGANISM="Gloeochaete witrockiana, Strain SAG 46.84" /LENGTH=286 /DNA_ID=CAMNT_0027087785 /DNA_START=498 /DNA_END=1358 /DNA_ORIENTATION=+
MRAAALSLALHMDRVLVVQNVPWKFEKCFPGLTGCYFLPITNCTEADMSAEEARLGEDPNDRPFVTTYEKGSAEPVVLNLRDRDFKNLHHSKSIVHGKMHVPNVVQSLLPSRGQALFWRYQLIKYIARPSREVKNMVRHRAEDILKLPRPIISMHVRYGDKWKEMRLIPFETYIDIARKLKAEHGVANILLSTETPWLVEETKKYPEFNWYIAPINAISENGTPEGSWKLNGQNSVLNLFLAADADYFIGTLRSNWCQLIDAIQRTHGVPQNYHDASNRDSTLLYI